MASLTPSGAGVRLDTMLSSKVFRTSFSALLSKGAAQPARAFNDLVTVRQFITGPAIFGIFDAPWTPVFMAVLFFLHPWLGVLSVFFALVQVLIGLLGHRDLSWPCLSRQTSRTASPMQTCEAHCAVQKRSKPWGCSPISSGGGLSGIWCTWMRRACHSAYSTKSRPGASGSATASSHWRWGLVRCWSLMVTSRQAA